MGKGWKMGNCGNCGGACEKCSTYGGCGNGLELTALEISFLQELGQFSFLPVARKMSDMIPVYLENGEEEKERMSLVIQCLEKKMLVDISYDPLPGADMSAYKGYPVHGSIALTARGQQVLELMEVQGIAE